MIRLLKQFADWLDARYPQRLEVTVAQFDAMRAKEASNSKDITGLRQDITFLKEDIAGLNKTIAALKDFLSKGGLQSTIDRKRRDEFIKTGSLPADE